MALQYHYSMTYARYPFFILYFYFISDLIIFKSILND